MYIFTQCSIHCTLFPTPNKLVYIKAYGSWTCSWSYHCTADVPLHSSDVTISLRGALGGFARSYHALELFCDWNTRFTRYLARRKKKNKLRFFQGMRFSSILFNLHVVNILGVVQHKYRLVLIHAMVQDFAFGERLTFYSTGPLPPIFHLMGNLVPLHDLPFAFCISWIYHIAHIAL